MLNVTMETIQNRVAANRLAGKYTWVFLDKIYLFFKYYYSVKQTFVWDGKSDVSLIFENDAKVKVKLIKLDDSNNPLPGAVFNIINPDMSSVRQIKQGLIMAADKANIFFLIFGHDDAPCLKFRA